MYFLRRACLIGGAVLIAIACYVSTHGERNDQGNAHPPPFSLTKGTLA